MKYYHKYEYNNIRNTDQLLLRSNINYVIKRKYEYEKKNEKNINQKRQKMNRNLVLSTIYGKTLFYKIKTNQFTFQTLLHVTY